MSGGGACWEGDHCEGSLRDRPGGAWPASSDQGDLHDGIAVMKYIHSKFRSSRPRRPHTVTGNNVHTYLVRYRYHTICMD